MPSIYADADELLAAMARRNRAARELEDANRRALAALEALREADAEVSRARERLAAEIGVA